MLGGREADPLSLLDAITRDSPLEMQIRVSQEDQGRRALEQVLIARTPRPTDVLLSFLAAPGAPAQEPDPDLMSYIQSIRAIDDHAHVVAPDYEHDTDYDALRCESLPPGTALPPANTSFGPDLQGAWKALYDFAGDSDSPEILKQWQERQKAVRGEHGDAYFDWILDRAGFDTVLANRVRMAAPLDRERFRWVPYDDALLFPLNNARQKGENPERKVLYEAEESLLGSYVAGAGAKSSPVTLDGYLENVVRPTLKAQKEGGAVALKFEAA